MPWWLFSTRRCPIMPDYPSWRNRPGIDEELFDVISGFEALNESQE
jgi:hypothetical protein